MFSTNYLMSIKWYLQLVVSDSKTVPPPDCAGLYCSLYLLGVKSTD